MARQSWRGYVNAISTQRRRVEIRKVICDHLPVLTLDPGINVFSDLVFRDPVTLLNFPFQLIASAGDLVQIVVGEITPLLFDFTFGLLPVSLEPNSNPSQVSYVIRHTPRVSPSTY